MYVYEVSIKTCYCRGTGIDHSRLLSSCLLLLLENGHHQDKLHPACKLQLLQNRSRTSHMIAKFQQTASSHSSTSINHHHGAAFQGKIWPPPQKSSSGFGPSPLTSSPSSFHSCSNPHPRSLVTSFSISL